MQQTFGKSSSNKTITKVSEPKEQKLDREKFIEKVESFLSNFCQEQIKEAEKVGPGYVGLWEEIAKYISGGEKRIRPYLVAVSYHAHGGEDVDSIVPVASSIEIFHTFGLIHDDIIDRDTVRHGSPNITGSYLEKYKKLAPKEARHYADSAALLAGDLLQSATYGLINSYVSSPSDRKRLISYYQEAMFLTGGGQFIDAEAILRPIDQSDPDSVMLNKTSVYSFKLPLAFGAVLAGAQQDEINKIEMLGIELGLIFQDTDDLLGVFGNQEQTGKSNQTDIKEKKRTNLIKSAYQSSNHQIRQRLDELYDFDHSLTEDEVSEVFDIINESGAKKAIEQSVEQRGIQASKQISNLDITNTGKQALLEILKKISKRDY